RTWVERNIPRKRLRLASDEELAAVGTDGAKLGTEPITVRDKTRALGWNGQRVRTPEKEPVTTAQIAASLVAGGKANHAVRVMPGLRLPEAKVPLDPYVLGAWLGDGHSATPRLTTIDQGIVDRIRAAGIECEPASGRLL